MFLASLFCFTLSSIFFSSCFSPLRKHYIPYIFGTFIAKS